MHSLHRLFHSRDTTMDCLFLDEKLMEETGSSNENLLDEIYEN